MKAPITSCAVMLCVSAAPVPTSSRPIYEYVRSNQGGGEEERILVFRPSPERVEVVKMRERCTNAAYVIADVDRSTGSSRSLSAGRLRPDAKRETFGAMHYDIASASLVVELDMAGRKRSESLSIPSGPWHLYDFDLASLSAVLDGKPAGKAPISFILPLAWNGDGPLMRDLGRVTLTFQREEEFVGRRAFRYLAAGTAASFKGGPIWLDASRGFVLGADWGTPNHAEYRDFALRLVAVHPGGERWWRSRLTRHFAGCPA